VRKSRRALLTLFCLLPGSVKNQPIA
jgi:hypothetical protein